MNEGTSRANAAARREDPPPESAAAGRIAVLIPCLDEETTIAKVVTDFHRALPDAAVYVYDNNSTDRTAEFASRGRSSFIKLFTAEVAEPVARQPGPWCELEEDSPAGDVARL